MSINFSLKGLFSDSGYIFKNLSALVCFTVIFSNTLLSLLMY